MPNCLQFWACVPRRPWHNFAYFCQIISAISWPAIIIILTYRLHMFVSSFGHVQSYLQTVSYCFHHLEPLEYLAAGVLLQNMLDRLPLDISSMISAMLSTTDRHNAAKVSQEWEQAVYLDAQSLQCSDSAQDRAILKRISASNPGSLTSLHIQSSASHGGQVSLPGASQ